MKGFESEITGAKGEWYRKVRETIAQVEVGWLETRLVEFLGAPDEVSDDSTNQSRQFQELMESVAGGPTIITYGVKTPVDRVLHYQDPYRARKRYAFAVRNGVVCNKWEETVAATEA